MSPYGVSNHVTSRLSSSLSRVAILSLSVDSVADSVAYSVADNDQKAAIVEALADYCPPIR